MSYLWHFYSYSKPALDAVVGSKDAEIEQTVVEAVTWDDWDEGNTADMERLGRRLIESTAPYEGLPEADAKTLDEVIKMLFSPEGLEEQLEIEPESPDGVHESVIEELISRGGPAIKPALLPILQKRGRRYGQSTPTLCEYCLLDTTEVCMLQQEVTELRSSSMPWSDPAIAAVVDECLLAPLESAKAKGKSLFGHLG